MRTSESCSPMHSSSAHYIQVVGFLGGVKASALQNESRGSESRPSCRYFLTGNKKCSSFVQLGRPLDKGIESSTGHIGDSTITREGLGSGRNDRRPVMAVLRTSSSRRRRRERPLLGPAGRHSSLSARLCLARPPGVRRTEGRRRALAESRHRRSCPQNLI